MYGNTDEHTSTTFVMHSSGKAYVLLPHCDVKQLMIDFLIGPFMHKQMERTRKKLPLKIKINVPHSFYDAVFPQLENVYEDENLKQMFQKCRIKRFAKGSSATVVSLKVSYNHKKLEATVLINYRVQNTFGVRQWPEIDEYFSEDDAFESQVATFVNNLSR
jgi:hypothetical protein